MSHEIKNNKSILYTGEKCTVYRVLMCTNCHKYFTVHAEAEFIFKDKLVYNCPHCEDSICKKEFLTYKVVNE